MIVQWRLKEEYKLNYDQFLTYCNLGLLFMWDEEVGLVASGCNIFADLKSVYQ